MCADIFTYMNIHEFKYRYAYTTDAEYMCALPYTHIPLQFGDSGHLTFMKYFKYFFRLLLASFSPS